MSNGDNCNLRENDNFLVWVRHEILSQINHEMGWAFLEIALAKLV